MEITWPNWVTTSNAWTTTSDTIWGTYDPPYGYTPGSTQSSPPDPKQISIAAIKSVEYIKAFDETCVEVMTVSGEEVRLMFRQQDVETLLSLLDKRYPHPSEDDLADLMDIN